MSKSIVAGTLVVVTCLAACTNENPPSADGGAGGDAGSGGQTSSSSGSFTEPRRYFLRLDDSSIPDVVLELDKQKALEVFGVDAAKQIKVLDVDTTTLLENVVLEIQNACGTAWQNDNPDPMHDCQLTALGQTFGANWQISSEYALVRMLTTTPANANVIGTSLEDLAGATTFSDVLSESLGITKTSTFITIEQLATTLQQQLLGTHPAIANIEGKMPVTLYDALLDLTPLAQKLGPVGSSPWDNPGEHPGVLVPDDSTFTTKSDALLPDFRMRVVASSNLKWVDGIDLSDGGGEMFLSQSDSVLNFDFNDPQKLQITGIADAPTVDMRFSVHEFPGVVPSCTQVPDCQSNYPNTPVGIGTLWTQPPWQLESVIGGSALATYFNRVFNKCYFVINNQCVLGVEVGQNGDPSGWSNFIIDISSGQPPVPVQSPDQQFLWELLTEVAQTSLHDPNGDGIPDIPEGQLRPVFSLRNVPIGLLGPDLIAQMRPNLQAQAKQIADIILGKFWKNNTSLDFFYQRATPSGTPYLFFVADTDTVPDPDNPNAIRSYSYDKPGFFTSPDLSNQSKVSSKQITGVDDVVHEKYQLPTGKTTLYMQDDKKSVYEVVFYVPESSDDSNVVVDIITMSP